MSIKGKAVYLGLVLGLTPALAAHAGEAARPADSFVDSIGVNIHSAFPWVPSYTQWDAATAAVKDIGLRYVRDIPDDPARLNALTAATGAKVDVIVQYGWGWDMMDGDKFAAAWANTQTVNNIAFLELPNEPEPFPDWVNKIHVWTNAMYNAKLADARLANTPMVSAWVWGGDQIADLRPLIDYGNTHIYPSTRADEGRDHWVGVAQLVTGPDKPVMATEVGYSNVPLAFSESQSAKLLLRTFMDYYRAGVAKTFSYDLMDDGVDTGGTNGEAHYGLLRSDGSYKPAATALKRMIGLLADPGPAFAPVPLNYTLAGASDDVRHVLLQKRDGTYWLALWQEVDSVDAQTRADLLVSTLDVTLHLDRPVVRATRYVPNDSDGALGSVSATRDIGLGVNDEVTLLSLRLAGLGDANADGVVNQLDFGTLLANYDTGTTWAQGDFNLDGHVGFADLQILEMNFGQGLSAAEQGELDAAGIAVPEPSSCALVLGAAGMLMRRGKRIAV